MSKVRKRGKTRKLGRKKRKRKRKGRIDKRKTKKINEQTGVILYAKKGNEGMK